MSLRSVNPATGEVLQTYAEDEGQVLERKLALASETFRTFSRSPLAERARRLARAAELLEGQKERWGRLMVQEMGKPLRAAIAEAEKCAWVCRHYAEHGPSLLADSAVDTGDSRSFTRPLPLGPVLAVMPWNFPFWQVFRFAAPALMAGNVGLLKHASNVPGCSLAIEEVLNQAGFPPGAFQALLVGSGAVARIIEDPRVVAVTLTGSEGAGAAVGGTAGRALKKTVLELGGSDPFVVLPSADLERAAKAAVAARVINNGQSCIAAKRFIVHRDVYPEFERRFVEHLAALRVGDPMEDGTDVGPLATPSILEEVEGQVADAVAHGAKLLHGGGRLAGPGNFYAPTALTAIPRAARMYREEVFGPVAALHPVGDLDEAIAVANDSPYGLGSSVWTSDPGEQQRLIDELQAGLTFVNAMVASDPRLPFGGVKRSGHGRELGREGLFEFVNLKSVSISGVPASGTAAAE